MGERIVDQVVAELGTEPVDELHSAFESQLSVLSQIISSQTSAVLGVLMKHEHNSKRLPAILELPGSANRERVPATTVFFGAIKTMLGAFLFQE